jgi:hypothetical protein
LDAVLAEASAEIQRRSTPDDGAAGLARREGFPTAERMVAQATGGSTAEAGRLIAVGAAGSRWARVTSAVKAGSLSVEAASAITSMLDAVTDATPEDALQETERELVERARTLPLARLHAVLRQRRARLDAQTHATAEERRYRDRYLSIREDRTGMVVVDGRLDPETAAPLVAAVDGLVAESLRRRRDQGSGSVNATCADERTVPQMRADALADLARHALGCDSDLPLAPTTTVVVRMGLEQLQEGVGLAQIDGSDQPITATAARRMAAAADVIPAVLGGHGEVLDWGRSRRLFTRAQRMALVERDAGCAQCHAPPSWTEAHHIRWWERDAGPTDLSNAVLLCTACHHRVHRDGWDIHVDGTDVWFTPPAAIDPTRTPRRGGRRAFTDTTPIAVAA